MDDAAEQSPKVIIKKQRRAGGDHGHHGGAWKIAYADFVTAMMALFLLLWLLTATTEEQRRGISEYFENPLRTAEDHSAEGGDRRWTERETTDEEIPPPVDEHQLALEQEQRDFEALKERIEELIDASESLQQFRDQLLLDITNEGLRIQVIDREGRPMFSSGDSTLRPYAARLLAELTPLLNEAGQRISITGHTDAQPFARGDTGYSNWELSNDRANAARRALAASGLAPDKVMRVVGLADTVMLDESDPYSAVNRRISIVLMNRDTVARVTSSARAGNPDDAAVTDSPSSTQSPR